MEKGKAEVRASRGAFGVQSRWLSSKMGRISRWKSRLCAAIVGSTSSSESESAVSSRIELRTAVRRCSGRDCSEKRKTARSSDCFAEAGEARCGSASSSLSFESLSLQRLGGCSFSAFKAIGSRRGGSCMPASGLAAAERGHLARRRKAETGASAGFLGKECGSGWFAPERLLSSERKSPANGLVGSGAGVAGCAVCDRVGWLDVIKGAAEDWESAGSAASEPQLLRMAKSGARGAGVAVCDRRGLP